MRLWRAGEACRLQGDETAQGCRAGQFTGDPLETLLQYWYENEEKEPG